MKCIICGTEIYGIGCKRCGFPAQQPLFANTEHYQKWRSEVVEKYRTQWMGNDEMTELRTELQDLKKLLLEEQKQRETLERQVQQLMQQMQQMQSNPAASQPAEAPTPSAPQKKQKSTPKTTAKTTARKRHVLKPNLLQDGIFGNPKYFRDKIERIVFENSLAKLPANAWDVSERSDRSIFAWIDSKNVLHIGSDGIICANKNCKQLFASFINVKEVLFGKSFDTSAAVDMSCMFYQCSKLKKLDVSCFDTKNVTNMAWMFYGCSGLERLDLSGFDMKNVKNDNWMLDGCSNVILPKA